MGSWGIEMPLVAARRQGLPKGSGLGAAPGNSSEHLGPIHFSLKSSSMGMPKGTVPLNDLGQQVWHRITQDYIPLSTVQQGIWHDIFQGLLQMSINKP